MMLESETPTPSFNVTCGNKYSFVSKEDKKSHILKAIKWKYQETSKEKHLYNDQVASIKYH